VSVRKLGIVIAAMTGVFGFTACGSSGSPQARVSIDAGVKFAQCMRSHGITSFPDPGPSGPQMTPVSSSPAFVAAQKACGAGPGGPGPVHPTEAQKLQAFTFAKCMRSHGVSHFPDPTYSVPGNPSTTVIAIRGMAFVFPPGLDPASPGFRQSAADCGFKLPVPPS
jgi:hypothetical protein